MSLKTKLLELFKYEPDKDGAQTFNIKSALNDNWDKIDEVLGTHTSNKSNPHEVTAEQILKYSSLDAKPIEGSGNCYNVTDMIEKPKPEEVITRLSILGRVLLTPDIFDILAETKPGAGGEIQLTDAMRVLAQSVGMTAVDFEGKRYDLGSKLGFLYANVESALRDPELGGEFREYLKELAATL